MVRIPFSHRNRDRHNAPHKTVGFHLRVTHNRGGFSLSPDMASSCLCRSIHELCKQMKRSTKYQAQRKEAKGKRSMESRWTPVPPHPQLPLLSLLPTPNPNSVSEANNPQSELGESRFAGRIILNPKSSIRNRQSPIRNPKSAIRNRKGGG